MVHSRMSLADKLFYESNDIFVGRDEILLDFFKKETQMPVVSLENHEVRMFYGVAGIGKTALRKQLIKRVEHNRNTAVSILNFEIKGHQEKETALIHLRKSLGKRYNIDFSFFDIAYMLYMNKAYSHLALKESTAALLDESDLLVEVINTINDIPGISLIPKVYNLYHKCHKLLKRYFNERKMSYLSLLEEKEPAELLSVLPQIFSEDLLEHIERNHTSIYIFIDTYEALWEDHRFKGYDFYVDEWIREWIQVTPGVKWVIFGREKLRWKEINENWSDVIQQTELSSLSDDEGREILQRQGIQEDGIVSKILDYSEGLPYSIELSIDLYRRILKERTPVKEDFEFKKNAEKLFSRFMKYLTKEELWTLELLALTCSWDKDLYSQLIQRFKIGFYTNDFDDFTHFSFIKIGVDRRWEMHALMRQSLRGVMGNNKFAEGNLFLFEYYALLLSQHSFKSTVEKPMFWFREAFFHGFSLVEKDLMEIDKFLEWFRKEDLRFLNYGKWEVSIPFHKHFISFLEKTPTNRGTELLAVIVYDLAYIYFKQIKYKEAEELFRRAVALAESVYGINHRFTAKAYYGLGVISQNQGYYDDAESLYLKSLRIRKQVLGENHIGVALSANSLATLYQDMGKLEKAEPLYLRSLEIRKRPENYDGVKMVAAYINLVYFYHGSQKYENAVSMGIEAIKLGKKVFGMNNVNLGQAMNHLGNIYIRKNDYKKAFYLYKKALDIVISNLGEISAEVAKISHNLAVLYYLLENQSAASDNFEKCLNIKKKVYGDSHFRYGQSESVYQQMKKGIIQPDSVYLDF